MAPPSTVRMGPGTRVAARANGITQRRGGRGPLLLGEVPMMTEASSVTVLLGWAGGAHLLGWPRLVRTDANR